MRRQLVILALAVVSLLPLGINAASAQPTEQQSMSGGTYPAFCMNRSGNGVNVGTHVIAWTCGQSNNDFQQIAVGDMCGRGFVTQTCPFTVGSGLNSAYAGDQIIMLNSPTPDLCVGGSSQGTVAASLQPCPDVNGNNGGWSTIDILQAADDAGGRLYYNFINRNFSDQLASFGQCNGVSCSIVVGISIPVAKGNAINLDVGDGAVQQGLWDLSTASDQWTET